MKLSLLFVSFMAFSTGSFAFDYNFTLESRLDFKNQSLTETDNLGVEEKTASNSFEGSVVRLNLQGNVNEAITYRARYKLNVDSARSSRDKTTGDLEMIYIDHKNKYFTTRFGKTKIGETLGRESMVSSSELFVKTQAGDLYDASIGNYRFGVTAFYKFLDSHKLTVSLFNPNPDYSDKIAARDNKSLAYGIYYSSKINSFIQPVLSYELAPQDGDLDAGTPKKDADYSVIAAGFKSEITPTLAFEFDWKQLKREAMDTSAPDKDGKTTSLYSTLQYKIDSFVPFANYVNDKFKSEVSATSNYKNNSYVVGTKWFPYNDVDLSYHVYYVNSKKEYDSNSSLVRSEKSQTIALGLRAEI